MGPPQPAQVAMPVNKMGPVTTRGEVVTTKVLALVRDFDVFTTENDPYGEHDFGSVIVDGTNLFWKIDLYEEPDVKDANGEPVVTRVLTIMLAEEY